MPCLLSCASSGISNELSVVESLLNMVCALSAREDNVDNMLSADTSSSDLPDDSSYPCSLLDDGGGDDNNEILLVRARVDNDDDK